MHQKLVLIHSEWRTHPDTHEFTHPSEALAPSSHHSPVFPSRFTPQEHSLRGVYPWANICSALHHVGINDLPFACNTQTLSCSDCIQVTMASCPTCDESWYLLTYMYNSPVVKDGHSLCGQHRGVLSLYSIACTKYISYSYGLNTGTGSLVLYFCSHYEITC